MGHRALVAYGRPDRLYSHWGGEDLALASQLTPETPLADGAVEPSLLADSISRDRILEDFLDPRIYEALYLVDLGAEVESCRVCWLEWSDGRDGDRGAIVELAPGGDDREFRTWFRASKTVPGDVIEMGRLSRRAARTYLEARVCEEYDGVPYAYGRDESGGENEV